MQGLVLAMMVGGCAPQDDGAGMDRQHSSGASLDLSKNNQKDPNNSKAKTDSTKSKDKSKNGKDDKNSTGKDNNNKDDTDPSQASSNSSDDNSDSEDSSETSAPKKTITATSCKGAKHGDDAPVDELCSYTFCGSQVSNPHITNEMESTLGAMKGYMQETLSISFAQCKDSEVRPKLMQISSLNFQDKGIQDPSPLAALKNLEELNLSKNNFRRDDLKDLSKITSLKKLNVSQTGLKSLSGIETLTQLRVLIADDNTITDVRPLEHLTSLREISLQDNKLTSIVTIKNLNAKLYVAGNPKGMIEEAKSQKVSQEDTSCTSSVQALGNQVLSTHDVSSLVQSGQCAAKGALTGGVIMYTDLKKEIGF